MTVAKLDTAREVALRRELYGRRPSRTYHAITADIAAGSEALASTVKSWGAFAPRPAALDEAERVAVGLQRMLGELRLQMQGGSPHGDPTT